MSYCEDLFCYLFQSYLKFVLYILFPGLGSSGHAQVPLDLTEGQEYYVTLRAITNDGNILQTTTDGFTVDITPPKVVIQRFGNSVFKVTLLFPINYFQKKYFRN